MQWWLSIQNGIRQCAGIRINQSWQPNRWNPRIHNMCGRSLGLMFAVNRSNISEIACVPMCACANFLISIIAWHILIVFIYWRKKKVFLWNILKLFGQSKFDAQKIDENFQNRKQQWKYNTRTSWNVKWHSPIDWRAHTLTQVADFVSCASFNYLKCKLYPKIKGGMLQFVSMSAACIRKLDILMASCL